MSSTTTIIGNLTREPELRYTNGGQGVASFGVAVTRKWKDHSGESKEQTSFFDVTAWGSLGENAAASLTKGSRVIVTGRLETREYEAKDGTRRTATQIVADGIGPELRFATVQVERTQRSTPRVDRAPDPIFGDESEF